MQRIHTATGSIYEISDDCITRISEKPIGNAPGIILDRAPLRGIDGALAVGAGFVFVTDDGPFTTSPITKIESTP